MERRPELQKILLQIPGVKGVYFNPPTNVCMRYPCIRYNFAGENTVHADNRKYKREMQYSLLVIDENPESAITKAVAELPYSRMGNSYVADNLWHFPFTLYF